MKDTIAYALNTVENRLNDLGEEMPRVHSDLLRVEAALQKFNIRVPFTITVDEKTLTHTYCISWRGSVSHAPFRLMIIKNPTSEYMTAEPIVESTWEMQIIAHGVIVSFLESFAEHLQWLHRQTKNKGT